MHGRRGAEPALGAGSWPGQRVLSFHMENQGAQVTCVEPPLSLSVGCRAVCRLRSGALAARVHRRNPESAQLVLVCPSPETIARAPAGNRPYAIPAAAGQFDVGLLASVLHCRRPFDLLESVARRTERTMIITEIWNPPSARAGVHAAAASGHETGAHLVAFHPAVLYLGAGHSGLYRSARQPAHPASTCRKPRSHPVHRGVRTP